MTKALVFYSYGMNNAGDMAICLGAIAILKAAGYDITFVSRFDEGAVQYQASVDLIARYYPDVRVVPGAFRLDRSSRLLSRVDQYTRGAAKLMGPKDRRMSALIDDCDHVFFNGGNLLRCDSVTDYARLEALFYPIHMAVKRGKRVSCLPQSTAKIDALWAPLLHKKLALFDDLYLRESLSREALIRTFPDLFTALSTDLAFFMDDLVHSTAADHEGTLVGLVLRGTGIGDIGSLSRSRQAEMTEAIASFFERRPELRATIVVQTERDAALSAILARRLRNTTEVNVVEEHDPFKLVDLYRRMDILIGMRLHACILAMRADTPVVGFFDESWGLKNAGIMRDCAMGYAYDSISLAREYERVLHNSSELRRDLIDRVGAFRRSLVDDLAGFGESGVRNP